MNNKFNLLQKLLPPDEKIFFFYFEQGANQCLETAKLFHRIVNNELNEEHLIKAKALKHESNDLVKETLNKLNTSFITPIEREDIQSVISLLNKIVRRVAKACLYLKVYRVKEFDRTMKKQAGLLIEAVEEMNFILSHFTKAKPMAEIVESSYKMKEIESRGDEILLHAMEDLFSGNHEPIEVIKLSDLYRKIEIAINSCSWVFENVLNIILKHS